MSELALDANDNEVTALEVREDYLLHNSINSPFRCAFCEIPLSPRAIEGETFVVAPHFSRGSHVHDDDCPYGERGSKLHVTKRPPSSKYGNAVDLPEHLVPTRAPRPPGQANGTPAVRRVNVALAIQQRGHLMTTDNHYTTSLLATVVEARAKLRKYLYEQAKKQSVPEADKHRWVSAESEKCPLRLFDDRLDYSTAFHLLKSPWRNFAIHFGRVHVKETAYGFALNGADVVAKTGKPFPSCIRVHVRDMRPNRMTDHLDALLRAESAKQNAMPECYAYGQLQEHEGAQYLDVFDSALIYTRT